MGYHACWCLEKNVLELPPHPLDNHHEDFSFRIACWVGEQIQNTVDGSEIRRAPVEVGSLSHYLQGFLHPRWFSRRISSISSLSPLAAPCWTHG